MWGVSPPPPVAEWGCGWFAVVLGVWILNRGDVEALRERDLELLRLILEDAETSASVKIQAIQMREKILAELEAGLPPDESAIQGVLEVMRKGAG